jgi:hypothetical protein
MSFIRATRPGCNLGRVTFLEEGEGEEQGRREVGLSGIPSRISRMRAAMRDSAGEEEPQGLRQTPSLTSLIRETRRGGGVGRQVLLRREEGEASWISRMRRDRRDSTGRVISQGERETPFRTSLIKKARRGGGAGTQAFLRREEGEASRISRRREDRRDSTGRVRSQGLRAIPLRTSLIKETEGEGAGAEEREQVIPLLAVPFEGTRREGQGLGAGVVGLRGNPCSTSFIKANLPEGGEGRGTGLRDIPLRTSLIKDTWRGAGEGKSQGQRRW